MERTGKFHENSNHLNSNPSIFSAQKYIVRTFLNFRWFFILRERKTTKFLGEPQGKPKY